MESLATIHIHLPSLPNLSKNDFKAIRSSWQGKLITRAVGTLTVVYVIPNAFFTKGDNILRLLPPDWPDWARVGISFALPLAVLIIWLILEIINVRKRELARMLAVRTGDIQSGYFRIGPYTASEGDTAKFDRADKAHKKVLDWLLHAHSLPLYLSGDSGSGKSSLLTSSVIPALRGLGWDIVSARGWQDPEYQMCSALGTSTKRKGDSQSDGLDLRQLLEKRVRRGKNTLVILDQFEEFIIIGDQERKEHFAALVNDLRVRPISGLAVLFVLRSDYLWMLDELGFPPFHQRENWFQVGRFTISASTSFMIRSRLELQPKALDKLLESAAEMDDSPGLIRPITLNVIGYVLAEGGTRARSLDAGQLVRHYISQVAENDVIQSFAPAVLEKLVTEQGTKQPRSEDFLVRETHLHRGEVRAVLHSLEAAALARPLDLEQGNWELSHDFVAHAVARFLGRRRRDWLRTGRDYSAAVVFGATAALLLGCILYNKSFDKQEMQSSSVVSVYATPNPVWLVEYKGYTGKFAPINVTFTSIAGPAVYFKQVEYDITTLDGIIIKPETLSRILNPNDSSDQNYSLHLPSGGGTVFDDNLWMVPAYCTNPLNDLPQNQVRFNYTFKGVDNLGLFIQTAVSVVINCK